MLEKVDYQKISDAIDYYVSKGFEYIEVPWIVSKEADNITAPKNVRRMNCFFEGDFIGNHVASGEQSFLELILNKNLAPGKYCCATPCQRDEKVVDRLHQNSFFKVELINYLGTSKIDSYEREKFDLIEISKNFFKKYLEVDLLDKGFEKDIISKEEGIELGSYGFRKYKNFSWIYGTGVAEPRLSYVLSLRGRGYHLMDIPKSNIGTFDKIYEEFLEFKDSLNQGVKPMALLELSDLVGSIEGYVRENFPGFNLDDLMKMNNVTKRAFRNGVR